MCTPIFFHFQKLSKFAVVVCMSVAGVSIFIKRKASFKLQINVYIKKSL